MDSPASPPASPPASSPPHIASSPLDLPKHRNSVHSIPRSPSPPFGLHSEQYYEFARSALNSLNPAPSEGIQPSEGLVNNAPSLVFGYTQDDDDFEYIRLDKGDVEEGEEADVPITREFEDYMEELYNRESRDADDLDLAAGEDLTERMIDAAANAREEAGQEAIEREEQEELNNEANGIPHIHKPGKFDPTIHRNVTKAQYDQLYGIFHGTEKGKDISFPGSPNGRWSVTKLLDAIMENEDAPEFKNQARQFRRYAFNYFLKSKHMRRKDWSNILDNGGQAAMEERYQKEIRKLCREPAFKTIRHDSSDLDATRAALAQATETIEEKAPALSRLICSFAPRESRASEKTKNRMLGATSTLCLIAHPRSATYIPTVVGMTLWHGGLKVDGLNAMSRLGYSVAYNTLRVRFQEIIATYENWLAGFGKKEKKTIEPVVPNFDNFEFREDVGRERQGDIIKFRSITNALFLPVGPAIPKEGLKQSMYDEKKPLSFKKVRNYMLSMEPEMEKIRTHHRMTSFTRSCGHKTARDLIDMPLEEHSFKGLKPQPTLTPTYPLAPIMENESYVKAVIIILENIFQTQLGLKRDDPRYETCLWLVFGDQKTVSRLLAVKSMGRKESTQVYDQYHWMLPCLGLFHLRMNYIAMLYDLFWTSCGVDDTTSLSYAFNHWGLHKGADGKDFSINEDLVIHMYDSTMLALAHKYLKETGAMQQGLEEMKYEEFIKKFNEHTSKEGSKKVWDGLLNWLEERLKEKRDGEDGDPKRSLHNDHWQHRLIFCRLVEIYLTLKEAIRTSDIELLRIAIHHVTIVFQAPTVNKTNYQKEMLRQLHVLSDAADPILANAILACSLINLSNGPRSGFEMDLALEQLNCAIRLALKHRGAGAWDTDKRLRDLALLLDDLTKTLRALEAALGRKKRSGKHGVKDSREQIFSMAQQIARSGTLEVNSYESRGPHLTRALTDIVDEGWRHFNQNCVKWNKERYEVPSESVGLPEDDENASTNTYNTHSRIDGGNNEEVRELFNDFGTNQMIPIAAEG